jgi:hypothetical protein
MRNTTFGGDDLIIMDKKKTAQTLKRNKTNSNSLSFKCEKYYFRSRSNKSKKIKNEINKARPKVFTLFLLLLFISFLLSFFQNHLEAEVAEVFLFLCLIVVKLLTIRLL